MHETTLENNLRVSHQTQKSNETGLEIPSTNEVKPGTRDQGLHKPAAFKTARHIRASVHHTQFESELDSNRGGVIESDHFPASVHHTQFESELDSNTPPHLNPDLRVGENIVHYVVIALRALRIEQAHAARLKMCHANDGL